MGKYLSENFSYGSRWELFLDLDTLEEYINSVIKNPIISLNSKDSGLLVGRVKKNIYCILAFKNARLMYATPFYLIDTPFFELNITKAEYTKYNETFINIKSGDRPLKALALDYDIYKDSYKKGSPIYLSAIAYSISKVDLIYPERAKGFMKQEGFFHDEYVLTSKVASKAKKEYKIDPINSSIRSLPLYAGNFYLDEPMKNDFAAGDIFLSCYTKDFYDKLTKTST